MAVLQENRLQGIVQLLVQENLIDKEKALTYQQAAVSNKVSLLQYLVNSKILPAQQIALTVAQSFGIPLFDLDSVDIEIMPLTLVNEKLMRRHSLIPLFMRGKQLFIATDDPSKQLSLKEIQFHTGLNTSPVVVETDKLYQLIDKLLNEKETQGLADYFEESKDLDDLEFSAEEEERDNDTGLAKEDAPVVKFVNRILVEAIKKRGF